MHRRHVEARWNETAEKRFNQAGSNNSEKGSYETYADQKLKALSELTGTIAHDFNNIIGVIVANAELAVRYISESGEKAGMEIINEKLEKILRAASLATGIVKQISDFAQNQEPAEEPILLSSAVRETLDLLRPSLPKNISLRERFEDEAGVVAVKTTHIHQIIINLCKNAIHAMRDAGGILDVSLENVAIGTNQDGQYSGACPGDYIQLTVKDTGHGMTPEVMEKIFDSYFTTKKNDEGTGLGLAIVHEMVKKYGGTISVSSEPGNGTSIQVLLPVAKSQRKTHSVLQS